MYRNDPKFSDRDHMIRDPDLIPENDYLYSDEEDEFSGFDEDDIEDPFIDLSD